MLSVLIPVYNYNIVTLVTSVHSQLTKSKIDFEILVQDDCSKPEYNSLNKTINTLSKVSYFESKTNIGRTATRQAMANKAKYDWLLFLDADVLPKHESFINNYITHINNKLDVIFGGICYEDVCPDSNYSLRWTYGKNYEAKTVREREIAPYKNIVSANMLIKKSLFNTINSKVTYNAYGLDIFFGAQLNANQSAILHIENPVFHLGLEDNSSYIKKVEAVNTTLLKLIQENDIFNKDHKLLSLFLFLKKTKLNILTSVLYKLLHKSLKAQLKSNTPSMLLFQCYRILYLCYADLNTEKV